MSETTIKEISPQQAWEILEAEPQALLLDVRTSMEYEYVGHPPNALHIPWMDAPDWNIDTGFVDKVRQALVKRTGSEQGLESIAILAICRSGKRSQAAAEELARQGFDNLYNIEDGFEGDLDNNKQRNTINGWRFADLPWEQS
ncbi:MAG: rhodanese-like domain-containing protein [Gammaproteobacteria bacterium]|nr:MAG: rhodanese-like domain-containing protein [Gammaproteobacteria bacterium]